ncbi:MAG: TatD family hydrolase [Anaerohalosphaera sp.]|nr:TatD family hydrolase [Anaerohalosphaera sp.]
MELIDTHAHLTFEELESQAEDVIARSIEAGVVGWVTIGTDREQMERAVALADRFENMWAAAGIHPHYAKDAAAGDVDYLRQLAADRKIVAIGECGLDFHYNFSAQDMQRELFRAQLKIAAEAGLPVVVHTRNAFDESMSILDEFAGQLKDVVIHCYGGDAEQTELVLSRGYHISFTGIITFKKSDELREVAKLVPLDRMMVETDCPYISPTPVRNQRPCEPAMLVHTAKTLAELKGVSLDEFSQEVTATSQRFFNIQL